MTNIEKIIKEFSDSADVDKVPNLSTHKWKELNSDYTKQEIKEGLASYIINNKPKFPFRKIELSTVKNKFASLLTEDLSHYIITPDKDKVLEKYNDYKNKCKDFKFTQIFSIPPLRVPEGEIFLPTTPALWVKIFILY